MTNTTQSKVARSAVRIVEASGGGWVLHWSPVGWEVHETAVEALNAVRHRDQMLVDGGQSAAVTTVVWEPLTSVGRRVVAAITNTKKGKN